MNSKAGSSRPLVVCLHGSAGDSGMWENLNQSCRGRCKVLAPRLEGQGQHPLADDVESVLRQIGFSREPFHLVSHGRGAGVAAGIANLYPERIASCIMYEPAGITPALARGLRVPVQILSGTRSWEAARRMAEHIAERVNGANLLKIFGLRHMAPLTHPDLVNSIILDYILPLEMPGQAVAA